MSFVKKNGLNHFLNSIKNYRENFKEMNAPELIANESLNIVLNQYNSSNVKPDAVLKEVNNSKIEIVAKGEKLPFIEFGTGLIGKAERYPERNLPEQSLTISFESPKGIQQSTKGWQYNYRAEQAKEKGIELKDYEGFEPQAHMLKSFEKIREKMPHLIRMAITKKNLKRTGKR